jgi:ribulose-phosphate 3-epimerase
MQLYPAILTDSLETLQAELEVIRAYPQLSTVHLDVVDGFFTDNLTVTPLDLLTINFDGLEIIFHLMVNEPIDFVSEIVSIKDRLPVKGIVAHIERMSSQSEYIGEVKRHEWQVGIALDLHTPLESIESDAWDQLDILQLMSIEAGFQGQPFSAQVIPKCTEALVHLKTLGHSLELVADGGIGLAEIDQLKPVGVNSVVVGSDIWQAQDPSHAVESLIEKTT